MEEEKYQKAQELAKDKNIFNADKLKEYWSNGKKLTYNGIKYRVGRMSYGDYFLEPKAGWKLGERDGFAKGTLWLQTISGMPYFYEVNKLLSFINELKVGSLIK